MTRRPRHLLATAAALAAWGFGAPPARAAVCTPTETGASFGTASSFAVRPGGLVALGNFSTTCGSGLMVGVLSGDTFKATLNSDNGFVLRNTVDASRTVAYVAGNGSGTTYTQGGLVINAVGLNLLSVLVGRKATVPLRLATQAANVPAGTYRDTLRLTWNYNFCDAVSALNACLGTVYAGTDVRTVPVELQVYNDCQITPGSIQFGPAALPANFSVATSQMALVCTADMTFSIGLSAGSNPGPLGRRQMRDAVSGGLLAYDIYFDNTTTPWGSDPGTRVQSSQAVSGPTGGKADGTAAHVFPYRAKVYPDQTPPPAGDYKDTVIINVQF